MAYYILNVIGGDASQANRHLQQRRWPVGPQEPHRGALTPGDQVLVYLGAPARLFIGRAELASAVHDWPAPGTAADPGIAVDSGTAADPGTAPSGVSLTGVEEWDPPVPMHTVLSLIDRSAGARADFESGVVRITAAEYQAAVSLAEPAPDRSFLVDRSGTRYALTEDRWRGDDGSPLAVTQLPGLTRDQVDTGERSLWRYQPAIPVDARHRISLGEGWTPMVPRLWSGHQVHIKVEWFNPTSSFKDRGVSVMMSHLRSRGATEVLEDSSGNGGSSVAAYAAAARIAAKIIVPAATSAAKILQARAYGAEIELVPGTRDEVADEAIRQSATIAYASHNWHPFFLQGIKTIAYEMWEMLGWTAPDNVVLVAGAGSTILGCDLAFTELLTAGQIERRPRLLVGQPEHWATIVNTLHDRRRVDRAPRPPTIAEGASIAHPVRLPETVAAIRRSGGAGVAVSEDQIRRAVRTLAAVGLYAEPTSAVAAAALDHFIADGTIQPGQRTVLVLTGSGLKSAEQLARIVG